MTVLFIDSIRRAKAFNHLNKGSWIFSLIFASMSSLHGIVHRNLGTLWVQFEDVPEGRGALFPFLLSSDAPPDLHSNWLIQRSLDDLSIKSLFPCFLLYARLSFPQGNS